MTDLKALCNGHIFSLYSPAAHLPGGFSKSEVFLFYRPGANNTVGKLFVAGASGDAAQLTAIATTMTEDQLIAARLPTVDAARLSAVTLDKATAELKATGDAVSADCCFQFGTPEMSLSLSADSKATRDVWTQGLLYLMSEAQKAGPAATAAAPAPAATGAARRFSFDTKDPKLAEALPVLAADTMNRLANNDATLLSIPALDFVSMMLVGRNFGFYADMGGKATRFPVFLFYKFEAGTPGYLYWCNPGTRTESAQTCLPLAKIDRLYVGKQVAVFTPEAKEECCFTLLTPEAMVNLEAGSASQASAWLYAIDAALRGYSQRRFHHTEADPKAARYYVDGINAPNKYLALGTVVMDAAAPAAEAKSEAVGGAPAAGAASSAPAAAADSQTSLQLFSSLPPSDEAYPTVTALKAGNNFVQHTTAGADTVAVHYTPDETKAGSLTYESLAHHGTPKKIPLQNISDMFVGKQAPELLTPAASKADPACCLTITYRVSADASAVLCLEAKTPNVIEFWVSGIHALIQAALRPRPAPAAAASAETSNGLKRLNVSDVKLEFGGGAAGGAGGSGAVDAFVDAPASPRARLPLGTDSDLSLPTDVLVAMIAAGKAWNKWTNGTSESVTVSYKKDETKSGSFYFSNKAPRFPLHAITEIAVGKQSADFAGAASAVDAHCVSFHPASGPALSLEGESKPVVAAWLSAINAILKGAGKDTVLQDSEADAAPVPLVDAENKTAAPLLRRFNVVLSAENMLATAPASLAEADQIALLTHGGRFTKYDKEGEPIWLSYVRDGTRSGALYWCGLGEDPKASRAQERAVPLHAIVDVYFGKQTIQFTSFAASREPEQLCVSLVLRDGRALNVAAPNAEQLSAFLLALQTVLVQSGKKVVVGDEKLSRTMHARRFSLAVNKQSLADKAVAAASASKRRSTVLSVPSEDLPADSKADTSPAHLRQLLTTGVRVRRFAAGAVAADVLVNFQAEDGKLGALCVNEGNAAAPQHTFALESLKEAVLGVSAYPALATAGFEEKRTVSLVFDGSNVLQFEAASTEALSQFLLGLHQALTATGALAVSGEEPAAGGRVRKFSVMPGAEEKAAAAAAAPAAAAEPAAATAEQLALVQSGAVGTALTVRAAQPKSQSVKVRVVSADGRLVWTLPASEEVAETYSLSLADVTEVLAGKKASKSYDASVADEQCLTLLTATKSLSIALDSAATVTAWDAALQAVIGDSARRGEATAKAIESATLAADTLSLFGGPPNSPAAKDALQLIHTGNDFKAYKIKAGKLMVLPMFLFYEPANPNSPQTGGAPSFGELYWAAPGSRAPKQHHHIKLNTVTDLFVGKHSDLAVFSRATNGSESVKDECCFTIVGTEQTLSVEANSAAVAQAWISALTYVLTRHGRDLLVQDEDGKTLAPNATPAHRRLSFLPFEVSAPMAVPNVGAAEAGALFAAGKGADVMSKETAQEIVGQMRVGRKFNAFLENHARTLLLFFTPSPLEHREGPGRLYWSHPSHRAESPLNSLLLTAIQDYALGKSAKAFQIPEAKGADESRCFSLTTKYGVFCFEAASSEQRDSWIAGINYLLVSSGNKRLQLSTAAAAASPSSGSDEKSAAAAGPVRYCFVDDVNLEALSGSSFQLARQIVQDPAVLATHRDAALRLMREGHYFYAFFFNRERGLLRHKIFVFFKPSVDAGAAAGNNSQPLGTLFWNERESYDENPVRRLGVHEISDVYVGKQSSPFRHPNAADVPDNTCVSIVSASKTLNLQAPSSAVLNVWLVGLYALLFSAKKDISLKENDRNAAAQAQAAQAAQQAGSWLSSPKAEGGVVARLRHMAAHYNEEHNQKVVQFMSHGTNFVKFTPASDAAAGEPAKQVVSLFYRESPVAGASWAEGTLYWAAAGQRTIDPAHSMPCLNLREVLLKKFTAGFKIAEAADAPEDRCVTLRGANGQNWYLCTGTTDELHVWLYGIMHLLAKNDKAVRMYEDSENGGTLMSSPPSASASLGPAVLTSQTALEQSKVAAVYDVLHRGATFHRYELVTLPATATAPAGYEIRKKQVFVWVEDDARDPRRAGALVWRAAGGDAGRIEISQITDIFVGKRTRVFVSLKQLDGSRVFSIVTPNAVLNLEGDSKKQVVAWVFGLYCALRGSGRATVGAAADAMTPAALRVDQLQASGLDPARTLLNELESDSSVEHSVRTLSGAAAIRTAATDHAVRSLLTHGRVCTAYSAVGAPRKEQVWVGYEPSVHLNGAGSLKWCSGDKPSSAGVRYLPLDKLSDIVLGKQNVAFRTPEAAAADPERCLSLLSDELKLALHLEARSVEAAQTLLIAIQTAVAVGGREVVALGAPGSGDRRFAVMTSAIAAQTAPKPTQVNRTAYQTPVLADTIALLSRGAAFHAHSAHSATPAPVFVFYKAEALSRGGALYWCEAGKRAESVERRVSVDSITHIAMGAGAPAFQRAANKASLNDDSCMSVYAGTRALHLAAASPEVVQCWFVALNALLNSIGKAVNEDGADGRFVVLSEPAANSDNALELFGETEDAFGAELDATASLHTISDVIVWEGFLKSRTASGVVAPVFVRLTSYALQYYASAAADAQALGAIALRSVLRARIEPSHPSHFTLLVSATTDDRVVHFIAASAAAAQSVVSAVRALARAQPAAAAGAADRLNLKHLNTQVIAFTPASAAAGADAKDEKEDNSEWPSAAAAGTSVQVAVKNLSLRSAVPSGATLRVSVSVAGAAAAVVPAYTVSDADGLVPRQRIAVAPASVSVDGAVLFAGAQNNAARNVLVSVVVRQHKAEDGEHSAGVVVGEWTNGVSEEMADWSVLPHPQAVAGFWQAVHSGSYQNEAALIDAAGTCVGSIELAVTASKPAAAAGAKDEKYPAAASGAVASAAAADEEDIVLALSPEETMQLLAERPEHSLSAAEKADAVRLASAGQLFTRYSVDAANPKQVQKEDIFVFYNAASGVSGSFFWCAPGTRVQNYKKRLPLTALSSVVLGKAGAALKNAVADRCITLTTSKFSLALEAKSSHQLTAFLCAVHAIKSSAGKRAVAAPSS